ncbi:hypothetical protein ACHAWF_005715 [Thalassiosira exigua]
MDASDSDSSVDLVFDSQPDAAPDDEEERRGVETVTVGAPNGDDDVERGNGRSSIGRRRSGRAARLGSFLPEPSLAESGNDALYMSEHQGNDDDDGSIDDDGANFGSLRSIPAVTSSGAAGAGPSQIPRRPSVHDVAAMDALKRSLTLASSGSLHSSMNRTNSFAYNSAALSRTNSMISLASRGTSASVSRRKSPPDLDEESQLRGGSGAEVEVDDVDPHTRAFRAAIRSACHDAFGVMGVDVWLHDEADGSFHHAPGGYYRHRGYRPEDAAQKFALERLEDETRADFVPPARQVPGAGLAGFFWSQCSTHDRANTWRDVRAIVDDPDQPPYPRMRVLCEAGYGKATGVPFDVRGHRGVVLYFARATADRGQLTEFVNDVHLRASADLIGAISASSIAAEASKAAKADRLAKTMRRVRAKMVCILVFAKWFKDPDDRENFMENAAVRNDAAGTKPAKLSMSRRLSMEVRRKMRKSYRQSVFNAMVECAKHKVRLTVEKSKGGHMQPPPCMPWVQAVWVFVGALLTLMVLSAMSLALVDSTGYGLVMGPFGALSKSAPVPLDAKRRRTRLTLFLSRRQ